ncbi:MAG: DUF2058 domain-containing protein [Candidatus Methylumidiphilus sp.]
MGNALRDQLLKAGLVNEKQAKKAAKEQQKDAQRQQGQGKPNVAEEEKQRIRLAQAEKAERDRLLNQQRQEQALIKAAAAQVRQLVEQNRITKEGGETPYNFIDGGKVKRLYLSDKLRQRVVNGQVAIIRLDKDYELVAAEVAEKIQSRDAASVVVFNAPKPAPAQDSAADDPYAKFQIPDDLLW